MFDYRTCLSREAFKALMQWLAQVRQCLPGDRASPGTHCTISSRAWFPMEAHGTRQLARLRSQPQTPRTWPGLEYGGDLERHSGPKSGQVGRNEEWREKLSKNLSPGFPSNHFVCLAQSVQLLMTILYVHPKMGGPL